jgi:hypothetical protein
MNLPVIWSSAMRTRATLLARTWSRKVEYGIFASGWERGQNAMTFQTIRPIQISHQIARPRGAGGGWGRVGLFLGSRGSDVILSLAVYSDCIAALVFRTASGATRGVMS